MFVCVCVCECVVCMVTLLIGSNYTSYHVITTHICNTQHIIINTHTMWPYYYSCCLANQTKNTICSPATVLKHRGGTGGVRLWVSYTKEAHSSYYTRLIYRKTTKYFRACNHDIIVISKISKIIKYIEYVQLWSGVRTPFNKDIP